MIHRGCCKGECVVNDSDTKKIRNTYFSTCAKLDDFDWLRSIPAALQETDLVEIRFKNTRKSFFRNSNQLPLHKGDIVAVESSPGHDIGIVCLSGPVVLAQLLKYGLKPESDDYKKVYRLAKPNDIEKWKEAIGLEQNTMIRSRKIAERLKLNMKIGDVEYQGDKTKAIFYYIADERVDFRELIKHLAEEFKIRVEMKQIGARQEAGRIGGISSCGRELCCSSWMNNFVSVTTTAARYQEVSLNPQKLAGQCGKLKCCLNFEASTYIDAQKAFPNRNTILKTKQGDCFHQKTDVHRGLYWYTIESQSVMNMIPISVERVQEIIKLNQKGVIPENLEEYNEKKPIVEVGYQNDAGQDSITRFEEKRKSKKKKHKRNKNPLQ
jgi:cell fate regulator YaaT (PSP1 superfamily)